MSGRLSYYWRQRVSEAELNLGFELLEQADHDLAADLGVHGIVTGAVPTQHDPVPDLRIDLTGPTKAYDRLGRRVFVGTGETLDCSVDHEGIPTEVTQPGNERWLGVFLRFDRLYSDPRTDGHSQQVQFRADESYRFVVRQAPEAVAGSAPKVALQDDEILVCDVRRAHGSTQILDADIDTSRRQAWVFVDGDHIEVYTAAWSRLAPSAPTVQASFDAVDAELVRLASAANPADGATLVGNAEQTGSPHALAAGTVRAQLAALLGLANDHETASPAHAASAVSASPHAFLEGADVQAQVEELVDELASETGATRVANQAEAGTYYGVSAGTLRAQVTEIVTALNHFRGYLQSEGGGNTGATWVGLAAAITGDPNSLALGTVQEALAQLLGHLNDHETELVGSHTSRQISTEDQDWMTGASLYTQLGLLPQRLGAYGIGMGGARKIGQEGYSKTTNGKTTSITYGTLHDALQTLVNAIANHRGQSGADCDHDALYARKTFTLEVSVNGGNTQWITDHTVPHADGPPPVTAYYRDANNHWVLFGTGDRRDDLTVIWVDDASFTEWRLTVVNSHPSDAAQVRLVVHDVIG